MAHDYTLEGDKMKEGRIKRANQHNWENAKGQTAEYGDTVRVQNTVQKVGSKYDPPKPPKLTVHPVMKKVAAIAKKRGPLPRRV